MGTGNSKINLTRLKGLEDRLKTLLNDFQTIQDNVNSLPNEYTTSSQIDSNFQKLEQESATSSQKLSQLLEITKDQQQVIIDIGAQYKQLCENYQHQQESLTSLTSMCEEKLFKYEEELREAKEKLALLEKESQENSEFAKAIGIRKTENMIKKDKMSPTGGKKSASNNKKSIDEKSKKLQTRNQKKNEKEVSSSIIDSTKIKAKENEAVSGQENLPNFLEIIMNEKKDSGNNQKETLTEVDINTL